MQVSSVPYPTLKLVKLLQALHSAQAREILSKMLVEGAAVKSLDLTHWIPIVANATKPLLLLQWRVGMIRVLQQLAQSRNYFSERNRDGEIDVRGDSNDDMRRYVLPIDEVFGRRETKGVMCSERSYTRRSNRGLPANVDKAGRRKVVTSNGSSKKVEPTSDQPSPISIYSPRVLDAVDATTFKFSRDTLDTATKDLKSAMRDLKKVLKVGLSKQQTIGHIANKVQKIFADPARALRIATTEISRAQHGGQLMGAKDSGIFKHKRWIAVGGGKVGICKRCRKLQGKLVEIDKPFYIDPDGGEYAEWQHPPGHPNCFCVVRMER